jgi:hypothetical protein
MSWRDEPDLAEVSDEEFEAHFKKLQIANIIAFVDFFIVPFFVVGITFVSVILGIILPIMLSIFLIIFLLTFAIILALIFA